MKKHYKILLHTLFWVYFFYWGAISRQFYKPGSHFEWTDMVRPLSLSGYIVFCSTFYINYLLIMPRLFKRKLYLLTWISWLALIFYFISIRYLIEETLYLHWFGIHNYFRGTTATFYVIDNVYFAGSIIIASILFWTIETWMQSEKEKMALQQEKINAELSFLKSQVNPHFLFNTLNNIYSLVYHKSDKSLPAILKLSELMRYMTRESDADHIQLSKEIQYIKNFIELQLLRTSENACVQFTLHGEPDNMNIAPLLLIPFIENGFKHGLVTDEHAPFIITISIINKNLTLYTHNKIRTGQKDHSGGVGLQNVKRRLELLYPDRHELQIQHTSEEYSCTLLIKL